MKRAKNPATTKKLGPGEYRPEVAYQRVEDLPRPKCLPQDWNYPHRPCPECGQTAGRDRVLHDIGDLVSGRPRDLHLTYSQHYCPACRKYFRAEQSALAPPGSRYTRGSFRWPSARWLKTACPIGQPVGICGEIIESLSPLRPSRTGWKPGGKRASERMENDYCDWALADFSGYLAVDELYDGPFCILSLVDNRTFKRVFSQVLDHDATQADVIAFFRRFQAILTARQLTVQGITTDGSDLYPASMAEVFGDVPHQLCQFHVLRAINETVLRTVAQVRKALAAQKPKLPRGRPPKHAQKLVQKQARLERKISDLFTYRFLFVQRQLTPGERETFQRITRGRPHLRTLREIMDEVYRLFDRRCRVATALAKLARLRQWVQRFTQLCKALQPLFSTNLEKALTFLDDRLLPSTSKAVERGNRRYRKMQKTVYRVRTPAQIIGRLALDMLRDAFAQTNRATLQLLHRARADPALFFIR